MANANAQTHDIDLASPNLNLDKYKLGVSQFDGFNYRNSPFISHEIKNLYTKQTLHQGNGIVINNDIISIDNNGNLKRNNDVLHQFKSGVKYYDFTDSLNSIPNDLKITDIQFVNRNGTNYIYVLCVGKNSCKSYYKSLNSSLFTLDKEFPMYDTSIDYNVVDAKYSLWYGFELVYYIASSPDLLSPTKLDYYFYAATEDRDIMNASWIGYDNTINNIIIPQNNSGAFVVHNSDDPYVVCGFINNGETHITRSDYENAMVVDTDDNTQLTQLSNYIPFKDGFIIKSKHTPAKNSNDDYYYTLNLTIFKDTSETIRTIDTTVLAKSKVWFNDSEVGEKQIVPSYDYFCPAVPVYCSAVLNGHYVCNIALSDCVNVTNIENKTVCLDGYEKTYKSDNDRQMLRLLYNNSVLSNISVLCLDDEQISNGFKASDCGGNIVIEFDIIDKLFSCNYNYAIFRTSKKNYWVVHINQEQADNNLQIFDNRYVIARTADYLNCYDLQENKLTHIADDWNNRFYHIQDSGAVGIRSRFIAASVGSHFEAEFQNSGIVQTFPGRQQQPVRCNTAGQVTFHKITIPYVSITNDMYLNGIDFYVAADSDTNSCYYMGTYPVDLFNPVYPIGEKGGITYTITEGNLIQNIPIIINYVRQNIIPTIKMLESTAFLLPIGTEYFALYYLLMTQENFDAIFSIQSQLFGIANNFIWSVNNSNGIITIQKQICSCEKLQFICSTPISAFFWSPANNTIYQFQGDNLLHRGQCIDEINEIIYVDYFENTNDICMLTDQYAIVLSEQYAYKIPLLTYNNRNDRFITCGLSNDYFWLKSEHYILFVSYKKLYGYSKQNIIVRTQLYGLGDNMLSETDCVFIRVFNAENEQTAQTVKVKGFTLTDKKTPLLERTFTITSSDWDSDGSYYIRYQPTYQKALGIQIEIDSTVPITYIGVSNIPDTKMITKL